LYTSPANISVNSAADISEGRVKNL